MQVWWLLRFYDGAHIQDDDCRSELHLEILQYDQCQGRKPSTLKGIGPIFKGDIDS